MNAATQKVLGAVTSQGGAPVPSEAEATPKESRTDRIARQARVVNLCLNLADRGLRRSNAALESLQPRQPGRITLLETGANGRSKNPLITTRWRIVRWRIRHTDSDGTVHWQAEMLPLSGASRRAAGRAGFHDTQAEVRAVIRAAVELIEWRASVAKTAAKFVTAMESHNRFGIPAVQRRIVAAVQAAEDGAKKRHLIRVAAAQLARAKAAQHSA
jgi:hypothetical protein